MVRRGKEGRGKAGVEKPVLLAFGRDVWVKEEEEKGGSLRRVRGRGHRDGNTNNWDRKHQEAKILRTKRQGASRV